MKKYLFLFAALWLFCLACALATTIARPIILYAQSLPYAAHATWSPNAAADNVTFYTVTIDGGGAQQIPATSCTTTCGAAVSVPTFGAHTVSVTATNFLVSTDPNSAQTSPATAVSFVLAAAPKAPAGATIGK